ncbi:hypothetical protein SD961_21265, partial [Erwinia sp. MMLR14_017]|uniref:hypothetical protein n=1 Tax=Erwinia sp. MMLR14_017 TaxID=3093842 RepID=UPI0029902B92
CPHRLSDKLLKSVAASALRRYCEVAYITLSSLRVNLFSEVFLRRFSVLNLSTRRPVSRCSVSMEAHYRDPVSEHKGFFDLSVWLLDFHSFR